MYDQYMEEDEIMTKVCEWPCGTVCLLDDIEEYLTFMSDDYAIRYFTTKELIWNGIV